MFGQYNKGIIPSLTQPGKYLAPSLAPPSGPAPAQAQAPAAPAAPAPAAAPEVYQAPAQQGLPAAPSLYDAAAAKAAADSARKKAIMDASIAAIQANIDSLATRKDNTLQGIDQRFNLINQRYADQEAQNEAAFTRENEANEATYSRNNSLALQSAAQGRQSLFANLAAIGAMGPSALKFADRAVASSANKDIGEGRRTFENNATTLVESRDKTKQEEKNRRLEAESARNAERQTAEYDYIEALQKAYSDMAQTYATGEDTGGATKFTQMAGGLYGQLAGNTRPNTPAYQTRDIALDTSNLATYLAGQRSNAVSTKGGSATAVNSPIYAMTRRREELV